MKIGIHGTGMVGETLGTKFVQLGHQVKMGSRTANNENAAKWVAKNGASASAGTFAQAAEFGNLIFLCLKGDVEMDVVRSVGPKPFGNKPVVDVSNPLDFSHGMPPSLTVCNTNSLGEEVQKALPSAKVIKTLNIVNCDIMIDPNKAGTQPTMFICGNDSGAKAEVTTLLKNLGWTDIIDLGDVTKSRATEMLLPIWLSLMQTLGHVHFGFKVVRPSVTT
jgi:8-hydroxy-5-deazaflavin:NADPH oxidoreductase